jgi:hypothetical protein
MLPTLWRITIVVIFFNLVLVLTLNSFQLPCCLLYF